MWLLSPQDRQAVQNRFAPIAHDVSFLFFTQSIGAPETALVTREILDEVVSLNDLRKYFTHYGEAPEGMAQLIQRNDSHLGAVLYRTIEASPAV